MEQEILLRGLPNREAERRILTELIDRYEVEVHSTLNPKDRKARLTHLRFWREELGHLFLSNITPAKIRESRDKLTAGKGPSGRPVTPATCNRYTGTLSSILSFGVRDLEWAEENPVRRVRRMKEPQGRIRFLSDDERERLLEACKRSDEPYLYTLVVLSIATGMRRGEVLGLRWVQVDLREGRIHLEETKNGERRVVPVKGHALDVLRRFHGDHRKIHTDLLFSRLGGDKPKVVRNSWERALREAEIENFRWHDLRHCTGSYAAMQGWTELEIAALLGHKTTRMVKRYSHLSDEHLALRAEEMANAVF